MDLVLELFFICRAVCRAAPSAGSSSEINSAMMEITTSSSINVKALCRT